MPNKWLQAGASLLKPMLLKVTSTKKQHDAQAWSEKQELKHTILRILQISNILVCSGCCYIIRRCRYQCVARINILMIVARMIFVTIFEVWMIYISLHFAVHDWKLKRVLWHEELIPNKKKIRPEEKFFDKTSVPVYTNVEKVMKEEGTGRVCFWRQQSS